MELEDMVVYNSNVAYHVHTNDVQQQQVNATIDHNKEKTQIKARNSKKVLNKTNTVIILMGILLLIIIILMVISVVTINLKQSTLQKQLNEADISIAAVLTHLAMTSNNISQKFFQTDTKINNLISLLQQNTDMEPQSNCGPGLWYQVAHLNMSDPSQQCPPVWREYNTRGIRACGRPATSTGNCATNYYLTSHQYSRVCGRVIGYQVASPDAFSKLYNFDGVNITSGEKRDHVWSYVAGMNEMQQQSPSKCPCSSTNGRDPPLSIGENYYCESGNPDNSFMHKLYSDDPLWDGQQCEGTCCNGTNSPPWFSVQLPAPTTEGIEVSICADESTDNEDTPIELLEIYVQ